MYDRYKNGFHQEVYDELLAMQEQIHDPFVYEEALEVMRAIMKRVRYNIELLIPRLRDLGYQFGKGFFEDVSPEEKARVEKDAPIFKEADPKAPEKVLLLEQLTGTLPFSLKCWYVEVGCVNLIGLFPSSNDRTFNIDDGCILDPLFIYSLDMALTMVNYHTSAGVWQRDPTLSLSPDNYFKYGISGAGAYAIRLPCRAFDAPFLLERHNTTLVNYLRICFRWVVFQDWGMRID
jgi:hypothetical protein